MDGNGRWARQRRLARLAGHQAGVESVRAIVEACAKKGIEVLSLFAFSSENWARPRQEVKALMDLFARALTREVKKLHENHIQLHFIGDRSQFSKKLNKLMLNAEILTQGNKGMKLIIAVNYGGRWDIVQAARQIAEQVVSGKLSIDGIDITRFHQQLSFAGLPDPDLFIRTSGEQRISNFFLWQLAYTELYFTDIFWPDFRQEALEDALAFYRRRERRFGYTSEQLEPQERA